MNDHQINHHDHQINHYDHQIIHHDHQIIHHGSQILKSISILFFSLKVKAQQSKQSFCFFSIEISQPFLSPLKNFKVVGVFFSLLCS